MKIPGCRQFGRKALLGTLSWRRSLQLGWDVIIIIYSNQCCLVVFLMAIFWNSRIIFDEWIDFYSINTFNIRNRTQLFYNWAIIISLGSYNKKWYCCTWRLLLLLIDAQLWYNRLSPICETSSILWILFMTNLTRHFLIVIC